MTHTARIVHHGDEEHILYIARVSSNQDNADPGLIGYLIRNGHWSPFEMVGACLEIDTTRDIGRQILRHRSFSFQEFSGRYATYSDLDVNRELRFKGTTNRQGSRLSETVEEQRAADMISQRLRVAARATMEIYDAALKLGIAPECARAVLPEGLTPTRLYMNGTLRSWIHYIRERLKDDVKTGAPLAQAEHRKIAGQALTALSAAFPVTFEALDDIGYFVERDPVKVVEKAFMRYKADAEKNGDDHLVRYLLVRYLDSFRCDIVEELS
jgi:thymidylate synthase (FAD)